MHEWSRLTCRHSPRLLVPCGQSEGGAFTSDQKSNNQTTEIKPRPCPARATGAVSPQFRRGLSCLSFARGFLPPPSSTRFFLEGQALRSSAKSGDDRRPDRILRKRAVARKSMLTREIEPSRTFA